MKQIKLIKVISFLTIILFLSTISYANSTKWPYETKNLKLDKSLKFGKLDNGFRYVIKYNKKPEGRVSILLDVQVGSINEKDNERGIAHYLEHMVFNGSKHFKPDELVKFFQRIGMSFGPDANAHTGFNETVYNILLPKNDTKLLKEGLLVMRDYADGALLLEKETQKEKGIILSEKLTRDSADFRRMMAELGFLYKGSNLANRFPIGTEKTIKSVDSELLKSFYNKWYNADNMVLIVVGDVDVNKVENLIKKQFSSMKNKKTNKNEVYINKVKHDKNLAFYYKEKNAGKTTVGLWKVKNIESQKDSIELRKDRLKRQIINIAFYYRLEDELAKENKPFVDAQFITHSFLDRYRSTGIELDTKKENWEKALKKADYFIRQAVKYGFTEDEVKVAKNYIKSKLNELVLTESTRKSSSIASKLVDDINNQEVSLSPEQKKSIYTRLLDEIDTNSVNKELQSLWDNTPTLVSVTGDLELKNPEKVILSTYLIVNQQEIKPLNKKQEVVFPYLSLPKNKSKIVKEDFNKDLKIKTITFGNNIQLHLKKTNFDKNKIFIAINIGKGELDEPKNLPALGEVTENIVDNSGFGKISNEQLSKILSGKITSMAFTVETDSFTIAGSTTKDEKELFFQLAYHLLEDPGYRKNVYDNYMKKIKLDYAKKYHNVMGVYSLETMRFLTSSDHRVSTPTLDEILQVKLDDIKNWINPIFSSAPIEINIVGDFDEKQMIDIVSRYFGSLDKRNDFKPFAYKETLSFPEGKKLEKNVDTKIDKAIVNVIYPTCDKRDIEKARKLTLLANLVDEKMRVVLREKLGETYSPFAHNISSEIFKDFGFLRTFIFASPDKADLIVQEVNKIVDVIKQNGISEDEMIRIKKPVLTEIKEQLRNNSYWLFSVLSGSSYDKSKYENAKTIMEDYKKITVKDINDVAKKYLNNEKSAVIIIKTKK